MAGDFTGRRDSRGTASHDGRIALFGLGHRLLRLRRIRLDPAFIDVRLAPLIDTAPHSGFRTTAAHQTWKLLAPALGPLHQLRWNRVVVPGVELLEKSRLGQRSFAHVERERHQSVELVLRQRNFDQAVYRVLELRQILIKTSKSLLLGDNLTRMHSRDGRTDPNRPHPRWAFIGLKPNALERDDKIFARLRDLHRTTKPLLRSMAP